MIHDVADGAGYDTVWARRYESALATVPVGVARDSAGAAVVLRSVGGEAVTIKYSASGVALWTNRYDSELNDYPTDLAVAADDSVIVAIVANTNTLPGRLTLVKYAAAGARMWMRDDEVTTVSAENPVASRAAAVATDAAGNTFAAVMTTGGYTLLKYGTDGSPLWTNHYSMPGGSFASTTKFAVDASGRATLVAALSRLGPDRMIVVRCSPSGDLTSWEHEWPGESDFLTGAAVDAAGDVYVAASVQDGGWSYRLLVARFDLDGSPIWIQRRPPAIGFYHAVSHRLALDSAGNVIVTAYETYPEDEEDNVYQTLTLKYSAAGVPLWSARAPGWDRRPTGLAVGGEMVHVTSGDSIGQSTLIIAYRPDGSQAAEATVPTHSPGQIAVGESGEFFVNFSAAGETRKFAPAGSSGSLSATITPSSVEVLPGSTVTFSAVVSGVGPFTYDWRYLGYRTGNTNPTLTIVDAQFGWHSHGDYTVIVSNALDYTISPEAHLVVLRPPSVRITPTNQWVQAGQAASLAASASGSEPLFFAWRFNGRPVVGATNPVLNFPAIAPADAGYYSVVVSNRVGVSTSGVASVEVVLAPRAFTNAAAIVLPTNSVAAPYPSEIQVSGITGHVARVTATLFQLTHDQPGSLAVLLVAPDGTALPLMAFDAEDSTANGVTLTFDDTALEWLPEESLVSGTYQPTRFEAPVFPPPAPNGARVTRFAEFSGHELNGVWKLFALDDDGWPSAAQREIAGGWALTFLQSDPAAVIGNRLRRIQRSGDRIHLEWEAALGWRLQRSGSLAEPQWSDVPETEGASDVTLPIGGPQQFFRLVR